MNVFGFVLLEFYNSLLKRGLKGTKLHQTKIRLRIAYSTFRQNKLNTVVFHTQREYISCHCSASQYTVLSGYNSDFEGSCVF